MLSSMILRALHKRVAIADAAHEALDDALALPGVGHFRVELQGVETPVFVGDARVGRGRGAGDQFEARRQLGNLVAMAHPDIQQPKAFRAGMVFDVAQ